jgi:hypothetical protein
VDSGSKQTTEQQINILQLKQTEKKHKQLPQKNNNNNNDHQSRNKKEKKIPNKNYEWGEDMQHKP